MSGTSRSKRTRKEDEMEHDQEEDGGEMEYETMQVEFEGRKPEDFHFNGIRTLLHQVFLKLNVNVSDLADWIIKHNDVGAVLQQLEPSDDECDDEDSGDEGTVMSVTTLANITNEQELQFAHQLKTVLLEQCKTCAPQLSKKFTELLSSADHQVGFLVNERLIGLPPHVAVFESLWKDVETAKKKDPNYNFSYYLLFSKTLRPLVKTAKQKQKGTNEIERHFMNIEEELFYKNSLVNFDISMKDQSDAALSGDWDEEGESYEPYRTIMIVAADKIPEIMSQLAAWIASNN